jgi:tetratricopeptide (TPR) repeat protein
VATFKSRQAHIRPLVLASVWILALSGILFPAKAPAASSADWELCERGYPSEKKIAGCTKIINNTRESPSERIKALLQRAWTRSFNKEIEAAYADGGEAIKLDPSRANTYETRARILANAREIDRAIEDYTAAINLEPNAYRFFERGELYRKKGEQGLAIADYKETVTRLNKEIVAHPDSPWLYRSRSNAHRNLGEIDKALSDFGEFLKRKKASDDARIGERGDLYLRKGDFDRAIADYSEAINKQPDSTDRYDKRALAYRLKGDYKRAILDYDQMVRLDDENPETYIGRGLAYIAAGKPERAVIDFTRAIDIYPEDATAFYNRAQAERERGNFEVAIGDYSAAIERNPRYAIAFNSRGRAYLAQNDVTRALADFNEAIRLDPKFGAAYCNRGVLHQVAGRMDDAIEDFGRAISTDPTNAPGRLPPEELTQTPKKT